MLLKSSVEEGTLAGRGRHKVGQGDNQPQGSEEMVDHRKEIQWKNRKRIKKSL